MDEVPTRLGESDLVISAPIGIGTWSWGDTRVWAEGTTCTEDTQQLAFSKAIENNVNFFDTAEIYGRGRSEESLGNACKRAQGDSSDTPNNTNPKPVVATKFMPFPWRFTSGSLISALQGSLKRLQMKKVELYQIHGLSVNFRGAEAWADALADAKEQDLVDAVGVSNYGIDQLQAAQTTLQKRGLSVATNQIEFSLLHRQPEHAGMLQKCKEMGVTVLAYSPLAMGRLCGKYSRENPVPSGRRFGNVDYDHLEKVTTALREVGDKHGGKTPAQVALNWVICKGCVPLCGAKNAAQVEDNIEALHWRMTEEDVELLDRVSKPGEQVFWQEKY